MEQKTKQIIDDSEEGLIDFVKNKGIEVPYYLNFGNYLLFGDLSVPYNPETKY